MAPLQYDCSMHVLLHICCAPCAIYPLETLRAAGHRVTGFFFNHNIHPYQEYQRRLQAVVDYAGQVDLQVVYQDEYLLEEFLAAVADHPHDRCSYCYASRVERAARQAAALDCDAFTTSLLYSRYQRHGEIVDLCGSAGARCGVPFLYEDYRTGWQQGIRASKERGLYRQQYCGCIYSEKDRYAPRSSAHGGVQS